MARQFPLAALFLATAFLIACATGSDQRSATTRGPAEVSDRVIDTGQPATPVPAIVRESTPSLAPSPGDAVTVVPTLVGMQGSAHLPFSTTASPVSSPGGSAEFVVLPTRLKIATEAVQVDAPIEYVGLTDTGHMGVPRRWENVAWFEPGRIPGQPGNAVIAGHLDSKTGPAVFWNLGQLKAGDVVSVMMSNGEDLHFEVKKSAVYDADEAPVHEIFGPTETARLNLITCDGIFHQETRSYDRRLVVYTEKIGG